MLWANRDTRGLLRDKCILSFTLLLMESGIAPIKSQIRNLGHF
jgi:hypothetical protein